MNSTTNILIHDKYDEIDFPQFIEAEKELNTFDFYSISRVLKASLFFCGFIVAAYEKKELLGFTYVFKGEEKESYFFSYIWISKEHRKNGLGDKIHTMAINECENRNAKKLFATCKPANISSLKLLLRNNWQIISFDENFYGINEGRFLLQRDNEQKTVIDNTTEIIVDIKDNRQINHLLKSGYSGQNIKLVNSQTHITFFKSKESLFNSKKLNLEVKYTVDKRLNLLTISIFPERVYYVEGLPLDILPEEYYEYLSFVFCFSTITNLHNYEGAVEISANYNIPISFINYLNTYNNIQNRIQIHTNSLGISEGKLFIQTPENRKVVLLSGGKDSVYQFVKILEKDNSNNVFPLYLKGHTINTEYFQELDKLSSIIKQFNKNLKIISVSHGDYGFNSLRVRSRARWRGLLLLSIAAIFSKEIYWGITYDEELHGSLDVLKSCPQGSLFYGDSFPTIDLIESLFNSKVFLAPKEFEIYKYMYLNKKDLLDQTYSCFNPLGKCDLKNDWEKGCLKCKTLHIYEKFILKEKLSPNELEYLNSFYWMGDPDFINNF